MHWTYPNSLLWSSKYKAVPTTASTSTNSRSSRRMINRSQVQVFQKHKLSSQTKTKSSKPSRRACRRIVKRSVTTGSLSACKGIRQGVRWRIMMIIILFRRLEAISRGRIRRQLVTPAPAFSWSNFPKTPRSRSTKNLLMVHSEKQMISSPQTPSPIPIYKMSNRFWTRILRHYKTCPLLVTSFRSMDWMRQSRGSRPMAPLRKHSKRWSDRMKFSLQPS